MLRDARRRTRARLGLEVRTAPADAERLPFADDSFDLVLGHAVLHHIPDLRARVRRVRARARARAARCCSPGEPSRYGDRLASVPEALGQRRSRRCGAARSARGRAPRRAAAGPRRGARGRRRRARVRARRARARWRAGAGFEDVRVSGEELLANWFGWTNRTLEATRRARRRAVGVAPVRLPRLPAAAGARPPAARVAAAGGDLLQPDARRAQARRG